MIECALDSLNVEVVLFKCQVGHLFELFPRERSPRCLQVRYDLVFLSVFGYVKQDELVWNDAGLLECERLGLGPWESLDDPRLVVGLILLYLLLD